MQARAPVLAPTMCIVIAKHQLLQRLCCIYGCSKYQEMFVESNDGSGPYKHTSPFKV